MPELPAEKYIDTIRRRHAASDGGGWHLDPEPHTDPDLVRTMISGWRRYIGVLRFDGWHAAENREFVLSAHGDMGVLLAEVDRLTAERDKAVAALDDLVADLSKLDGEPVIA
ncbi:hypothetical protein QMK19_03190 [Streptomyces sp. H10-C2]|uniref:hypothetical protein n=1 Tax=unclassified Streptomyces TaxID=2593676 RepID=UPI0024B905BD|nr:MULTISPECIES: hypothetical protein [unclassified Streptomyces]MDJ0342190.1 hypothetical protein [Streptomyces sp. PH10-H1]MDJ0368704.1 hypothetical protein [Streptomyces sp. H10-C2]